MLETNNSCLLVLAKVAAAMAATAVSDTQNTTFTMNGNFFNNKRDLPDGIKNDETTDLTFDSQTVHQDNPKFPDIVPDMWYAGMRSNHTSIHNFNLISDDMECCQQYQEGMNAQQGRRGSTWKKNCKHFVQGGLYLEAVNSF